MKCELEREALRALILRPQINCDWRRRPQLPRPRAVQSFVSRFLRYISEMAPVGAYMIDPIVRCGGMYARLVYRVW